MLWWVLCAGSVPEEGVGAMDVAGNCWIATGWRGSIGETGWHIYVFAQSAISVNVVDILCLPVEIMLVSISFKVKIKLHTYIAPPEVCGHLICGTLHYLPSRATPPNLGVKIPGSHLHTHAGWGYDLSAL